jgi:hypothetical protein
MVLFAAFANAEPIASVEPPFEAESDRVAALDGGAQKRGEKFTDMDGVAADLRYANYLKKIRGYETAYYARVRSAQSGFYTRMLER